MAFTHFIPSLWSASLLEAWQNEAVFANLVNRDYEGTATRGNRVKISGVVVPEVKDYAANGRQTSADAISDTGVDLLIDQEKVIDIYIDDIDRTQVAGGLEGYTQASGEALALDADTFLANMCVQGGVSVPGSAPTTGNQAFDLLNKAHKTLTKLSVPSSNRVAVVNAEFAALLKGADSKPTSWNTAGDTEGLRSGTIGMLLGSRIVESNNLPDHDSPQFVMFHKRAVAYVSQIEEVEALRAHDRIADRVRMLHVYGGVIARPTGVVVFNKAGSLTGMSLATDVDVARAMGLADVDGNPDPTLIPAAQALRLPSELARVERAFVREALRDFTPGPIRVQCSVVGGWINLFDPPADGEPVTVTDRDGNDVDILVADGSQLKVGLTSGPRRHCTLPSGTVVNVEYTAPPVPAAVTAAVAAIVARRLSVAPGSPESKFTSLTAGADFRATGAAWVTSTSVLTDDEKCEAQSYRPLQGVSIIARYNSEYRRWYDGWGWGYLSAGWDW